MTELEGLMVFLVLEEDGGVRTKVKKDGDWKSRGR